MNITIDIDIAELVYDIQNKTYLTGRSRENGDNHRQVAMMQANNDDENLNQVMRSISNGFARIFTELSEVMHENVVTADNLLRTTDKKQVLNLVMPANFNMSATEAIADAVHQYIVAYATSEWFTITNKSDSDDYRKMAEQSLELLRESVCKRSRPVRVTAKPE